MPGLGAYESRILLDSQDVMESMASLLTYYLRGESAEQMLRESPNDHIGLFRDGTLRNVSYRDLLFSRLSCETEERKVYEKYMGFAEDKYLYGLGLSLYSKLEAMLNVSPALFRSELTDYFSQLKYTSCRNDEAHRFSRALKNDSGIRSSDNRPIQYVLQDTPRVEATKDPLNTELLCRLEKLWDFEKLPESVKQPLDMCRTVFQLHVRYLWKIFSEGALNADVCQDGKHPDKALPRTDQKGADGFTTPGKKHRVSAKSRS